VCGASEFRSMIQAACTMPLLQSVQFHRAPSARGASDMSKCGVYACFNECDQFHRLSSIHRGVHWSVQISYVCMFVYKRSVSWSMLHSSGSADGSIARNLNGPPSLSQRAIQRWDDSGVMCAGMIRE